MERQVFIKLCGFACLGALTPGCAARLWTGVLEGSDLIVPLTAFAKKDDFKKYLIVQHESLQFPVCVYRFGALDYTALLMRCTHQQAELRVFGDHLECPAHGSAFDSRGVVRNGPAADPLRTFPVTVETERLKISLK